jgi:hypothetical protein
MTWYLTKTWTDPDDDVDAVQIHYMWTPVGDGAFFDGTHEVRWMTDAGGEPRRRTKVLSMPRAIWNRGGWNDDGYALHHYFEVFGRHGRWTSDTFTEEIVVRDLEFVDDYGGITNICIHWAVGDWQAPAFSPMEDPRFPAESEFASVRYYGYQDKDRYHWAKAHAAGDRSAAPVARPDVGTSWFDAAPAVPPRADVPRARAHGGVLRPRRRHQPWRVALDPSAVSRTVDGAR